MADQETIDAEYRAYAAGRKNGLVVCSVCHDLVDPETLNATCELCGREGCESCIPFDRETKRWHCLDEATCERRQEARL